MPCLSWASPPPLPFWHLSGELHFRMDWRSVPGKERDWERDGERGRRVFWHCSAGVYWVSCSWCSEKRLDPERKRNKQTQKAGRLQCSCAPELQCLISTVVFKTAKRSGLFVFTRLTQAALQWVHMQDQTWGDTWRWKSSSEPVLSGVGQNKLGSQAHLDGWTKQKRWWCREEEAELLSCSVQRNVILVWFKLLIFQLKIFF